MSSRRAAVGAWMGWSERAHEHSLLATVNLDITRLSLLLFTTVATVTRRLTALLSASCCAGLAIAGCLATRERQEQQHGAGGSRVGARAGDKLLIRRYG